MAGRRRTAIGTFGAVHYEKLPSGQIRARTRYRDDDGSLRRVSTVGATQRAAERNLKEALAARASRTTYAEVTPDSSFARLVELWLDDLDLRARSRRARERFMSATCANW